MPPELKGPGALAGATEAGYQVAEECFDTANSRPAQSADLKLRSFRPLAKGALRGFATIGLPCGLVIPDCPLFVSAGKAWAALPSKPVLDRDGKPVMVSGKRQYMATLSWADRGTADRWSEATVVLVRAAHPEVLS